MEGKGFESVDLEGIIPVGRYKGKLFSEVLREDPSYCTWVKSMEDGIDVGLMDFQTYLKEQDFVGVLSCGGKHNGKTYEEVMIEDPSYCAWVMGMSEEQRSKASVSIIRFRKFLGSKGFKSEEIVPSGKYEGKTFEEVMTEDPLYCAWVMDLVKEGKNSSGMIRFKDFLKDRGFQGTVEEVMIAGKHKGKTFEMVMKDDPSYCADVVRRVEEGSAHLVMLRLKKFLDKHGFSLPLAQDVITKKCTLKTPSNFAVDFWVDFFLLFFPRKKA